MPVPFPFLSSSHPRVSASTAVPHTQPQHNMASLPTLTGFLDAHLPQYGLPGPSTFVFAPGSTPLATWPVVLAGCAGYLSLIFGLQAAMRRFDAKPLQLRSLFVAHNLALVAVSAVLLYETLRIVFSHYLTGGLYYAMCAPAAFGGGIEFWYYRGLRGMNGRKVTRGKRDTRFPSVWGI